MVSQKKAKTLFERLRQASGNPLPSTLRKRIQRKATKFAVPPNEAIFILAKENKVGYLNDLKKLSQEAQTKISTVIRSANFNLPKKSAKGILAKTSVLRTKFGDIHEPLLSEGIKKDAKMMAEKSYLSLYIFENSLRNFIRVIMEKKYGLGWWFQKMGTKRLKEIVKNVEKRMQKEEQIAWHGKRGAHPIFYSDFADLPDIIKNYEVVFRPYFKNQKAKVNWLLSKIYETEPSRNVTAHHNPLLEKDLSRVHGNLMDWLSQLKYLRSQNLL